MNAKLTTIVNPIRARCIKPNKFYKYGVGTMSVKRGKELVIDKSINSLNISIKFNFDYF
jgi:hypothetical protein